MRIISFILALFLALPSNAADDTPVEVTEEALANGLRHLDPIWRGLGQLQFWPEKKKVELYSGFFIAPNQFITVALPTAETSSIGGKGESYISTGFLPPEGELPRHFKSLNRLVSDTSLGTTVLNITPNTKGYLRLAQEEHFRKVRGDFSRSWVTRWMEKFITPLKVP